MEECRFRSPVDAALDHQGLEVAELQSAGTGVTNEDFHGFLDPGHLVILSVHARHHLPFGALRPRDACRPTAGWPAETIYVRNSQRSNLQCLT